MFGLEGQAIGLGCEAYWSRGFIFEQVWRVCMVFAGTDNDFEGPGWFHRCRGRTLAGVLLDSSYSSPLKLLTLSQPKAIRVQSASIAPATVLGSFYKLPSASWRSSVVRLFGRQNFQKEFSYRKTRLIPMMVDPLVGSLILYCRWPSMYECDFLGLSLRCLVCRTMCACTGEIPRLFVRDH